MRTIIENGAILGTPGKGGSQTVQCMIINDDIIEYIGSNSDDTVSKARAAGAEVVDLEGHHVLPGFIDGHMHILMFAQSLDKIDIEDCKNLDEIRSKIRDGAKARPHAPRLLCSGWIQASTDNQALATMIDGLDDQDRPIFIDAKDLHSCWCNTAALKELNVEKTPDPPGGEIHRDEDGHPSGLLSEGAAIGIVWPHLANIFTPEEKQAFIKTAIRTYNQAGYTGMIEMATDDSLFEAILAYKEKGDFTTRLAIHWIIKPTASDEENLAQVDRAIELHKKYNITNSPDFRIAGIKMICDGVVDGCTASLSSPYSSTGTNADPLWPAEQLKKVVHHADAAGLQCALHAIGDRAVTLAIDTISSLTTTGRRHRIEHLELTSPADAKRLGQCGITASVQPVHSDPAILRAWPKLIGEDRLQRAFAYKDFHDHGANIALGTDSPTAPHVPFGNLYNATTRRSTRELENPDTTNPRFALSMMEALSAAAYGSAYSCFADEMVGSLEVGKKADFIVVDANLTPEKLLEAVVLQTWFDGRCVFKK